MPDDPNVAKPVAAERVLSIDALRGFDMFWIVGGRELLLGLVTALGAASPPWLEGQLEHVEWQGFTAWDLIMPLFLFVVGAAMPFSFAKRLEQDGDRSALVMKIVRRSLILFVLGMIVQGHLLDFKLATLHVFANTLQAIAAGYFVAGLLMLTTGVVGQAVAAAALLIGYWLLLVYVPLPGRGAGVLEPHANVALAVDEFVLGRYRDGTTYTWVLSSLTFTATVLLGVFAGHVLRTSWSQIQKLVTLGLLGLGCLAGGWIWAEWLSFPIIKHVWTSSMVLWAGGWSYLLLAAFYLVIDIWGWRRWAFPFVVIGMNAITIYVAYRFIPFRAISGGLLGGLASHFGRAEDFVVQFGAVALVWLVLYHLYRQRIFVRI